MQEVIISLPFMLAFGRYIVVIFYVCVSISCYVIMITLIIDTCRIKCKQAQKIHIHTAAAELV